MAEHIEQRGAGNASASAFDLVGVIDSIYSHRWLIICTFVLIFVAGVVYATIAPSIYQTRVVIQLESTGEGQSRSPNDYVGDVSSVVGVRSNADGEIQILGSNLVIGEAVDALNLAVTAKPRYFPVIGGVIARNAEDLSTPGIFGLGGFAWGNEAIEVPVFDVPKRALGRPFQLKTLGGDRFELTGPGLDAPVMGKVGQALNVKTANGPLDLRVASIQAEPGIEFVLKRASRASAISELRRSLQVEEQGNKSDVLSATLSGSDPVLMTATLNAISQAYVRQNSERKAVRAQSSLDFLNSQLPALKQQVEQAEQQYNEYRNKHLSVDISEQARVLLQQSSTADTSLYQLQQRRQELATRFSATHPEVLQIDKQIDATKRYRDSLTERVRELPADEQGAVRLMREMRVSTDVYSTMRSNMEQLQLVRAGKISGVRVVDAAVVPEEPSKPNRMIIVVLSLFGGLFAGLGLAFARDFLKKGVVDPVELQGTGLTMFGAIPMSHDEARLARTRKPTIDERLLAVKCPQDAAIEGLRMLRTAVQVAMIGARNNVVMLSGPMPHSGKSFTSANFAAVLAAGGKRVLLVDADLRRGHMHRILGLPWERGLAEVMEGSVTIQEAIRRDVLPNLDFLSVGKYPDNASELLLRGDFEREIRQVADDYDIVVVDAAAVLAVSDVGIIAPSAGTVLLLARYGVTRATEIDTAIQRLNQAGCKVNGLVLNAVPDGAGGYAYARRYGGGAYKAYYQETSSS
ncbi:polysaccharide biosynthesis tyrosine autokinase [Caballeronia sp. LZ035]|uniref:polysaccharide biosynthesis tyrosine autokinase n=1 Tax=Caballeronia sp. LZ035 TaxID=3038568 RepID=UPI0028623BCF|nr:polysaccharide biosynthesis tyrosine autokinase [Caballeronia sp. LZ035]MDR5759819.1 polysaccharide biosynthesis tyrosine autokinase [Caballeronia sp. LZ035]